MRTSVFTRTGRGLCAACEQEARLATSRSGSRRALSAAVGSMGERRPSSNASLSKIRTCAAALPLVHRQFLFQSSRARAPPSASAVAATQQQDTGSPQSTASPGADVLTQKPPSHYDLFPQTLPDGPPPKGPFTIDLRALKREFLRLQAAAHPDFHHHASSPPSSEISGTGGRGHSAARAQAEALSSRINEAYKTLSNPLLRAQYLLHERWGIDLAGDEANEHGAGAPELLLTVLEANEEIEKAESEADLEGVREENRKRIAHSEEVLADAFARDDVDVAKAETVRLRYWVNIEDGVKGWEKGKGVRLQH